MGLQTKLEQASTHKSAKTHAGNVFATHDLDLLPPPKKSEFPGLILVHFCVKFGDPICIGFGEIVRNSKH